MSVYSHTILREQSQFAPVTTGALLTAARYCRALWFMKRTPHMTGSYRRKNGLSCVRHVHFWVKTLPFINGDVYEIWAVKMIFQKGVTVTQSTVIVRLSLSRSSTRRMQDTRQEPEPARLSKPTDRSVISVLPSPPPTCPGTQESAQSQKQIHLTSSWLHKGKISTHQVSDSPDEQCFSAIWLKTATWAPRGRAGGGQQVPLLSIGHWSPELRASAHSQDDDKGSVSTWGAQVWERASWYDAVLVQ